ncbi:TadE/TadG family type IV pilus assembly protein [Collimonas antrihumi]|uniref:TadE/TadG family type IV pilus assembly protein n=1 Tax=Collimonas antrihumi TaxID=1940615 RepID=UPI001B8CE003|nr:TadE/TadG family type IV pilus assembly protein [Collimonas antrihumi]
MGARAKNVAQRGVAAIEFALIFPVFFMLLYGIITYALIFVAQQSLTLAAEEGARAALRYIGTGSPTDPLRGMAACNTVTPLVSWLGSAACNPPAPYPTTVPYVQVTYLTCPASNPAPNANCIKVKVTYPYGTQPLVPLLLGSLMSVAVPANLGGSATVQID